MSKEATSKSTSPSRGAKTAIVHDLPPGEKPTSPIVPLAIIAVPILALIVYAVVS